LQLKRNTVATALAIERNILVAIVLATQKNSCNHACNSKSIVATRLATGKISVATPLASAKYLGCNCACNSYKSQL
jgi:hypothetical protein